MLSIPVMLMLFFLETSIAALIFLTGIPSTFTLSFTHNRGLQTSVTSPALAFLVLLSTAFSYCTFALVDLFRTVGVIWPTHDELGRIR
jgi:hypothetical protein